MTGIKLNLSNEPHPSEAANIPLGALSTLLILEKRDHCPNSCCQEHSSPGPRQVFCVLSQSKAISTYYRMCTRVCKIQTWVIFFSIPSPLPPSWSRRLPIGYASICLPRLSTEVRDLPSSSNPGLAPRNVEACTNPTHSTSCQKASHFLTIRKSWSAPPPSFLGLSLHAYFYCTQHLKKPQNSSQATLHFASNGNSVPDYRRSASSSLASVLTQATSALTCCIHWWWESDHGLFPSPAWSRSIPNGCCRKHWHFCPP